MKRRPVGLPAFLKDRNPDLSIPGWAMTSVTLLALLLVFTSISSCDANPSETAAIDGAFDASLGENNLPAPAIGPYCTNERFQQPPAEITKNLDLLFVVDTSTSLHEELAAVADGIDAFVAALPADVDFQVAVMLAHGSTSSRHGKLYQKNSEPVVLKSRELSQATLRSYLATKLDRPASDNGTDGGEAGLYSLNSGIHGNLLDENRGHGFFRPDAALAVVFVADENDICAVYPEGVTPVVDGQHVEPVAAARDCSGITAQSVLNGLKELQGENPLVVAGILYHDPAKVPAGGENELGYGYLDVVSLGRGVVVELADGHYQTGLENIGTLATLRMNLKTSFVLSETDVNPADMVVHVDGEQVPYHYEASDHSIHLQEAGTALSFIDVTYCKAPEHPLVSEACQADSFTPKSQVKVAYSGDPNDGAYTTVLSGLQAFGFPVTAYTEAQVAAGAPAANGDTVLVVSRRVTQTSVSPEYVAGVQDFVTSHGGSLIAEYDGAALMFSAFDDGALIMNHFEPHVGFFDGMVAGGGALLPVENSTTYITDPLSPIMLGISDLSFLQGPRGAFAIKEYDGNWLHTSAEFISSGFANLVPVGTYPAVMNGRCGKGRVVFFNMTHFQTLTAEPVRTMVDNSLRWSVGLSN